MMAKRMIVVGLLVLATLAAMLGSGCGPSTDLTGSPIPNTLPDTRVTARPPDVLESGFVVKFYWSGFDTDGRIVGYQWKLSNNGTDGISIQDTLTFDPVTGDTLNPWYTTMSTDSTFLVTADLPDYPDDPEGISRSYQTHTFLVRAIDEDGGVDPSPAFVSFNALTLLPTISIEDPQALTGQEESSGLPSTVTVIYRGSDPDFATGLPTEYRYLWKPALLQDGATYCTTERTFNNNVDFLVPFADSLWTEWRRFSADEDARTVSLPNQLARDAQGRRIHYLLALQARDTAGAVSIDRTYSQQVANMYITENLSPSLLVRERFLGNRLFAGIGSSWTEDVAAGQEMAFTWSADVSGYAGIVEGYRYGWDVADPNDPGDPAWVDLPGISAQFRRTQPRAFASGSHTLTIEVIDNSDQVTRALIQVNVVPVPAPELQEPMLLIDDVFDRNSFSWPGPDGAPLDRDAYRDDFWRGVLGGPGGIAGWDSVAHTLDSEDREVVYRDAVRYRSLMWVGRWASGGQTAIGRFFRPNASEQTGDLDKYVWLVPYQESVGNLFYVGETAMINFVANASWELPLVFESREGNDNGYETVRTTTVRRGFGTRELPDGSLERVGLSRYPFSTLGVSVIDITSPAGSYYEYGDGRRVRDRRKPACVGLKGLVIDSEFKNRYMPAGEVFADTIWTDPGIDWLDDPLPDGGEGDALAFTYRWGDDEFYNADQVGRGTGWTLQQGEEWGCEGECLEPIFRAASRFDWVRAERLAVDPDDTWPDGYYGGPGQATLEFHCGGRFRDTSGRALTNDQVVAFITRKTAAAKPSRVGDVVFGFDPYRFDNAEIGKAIRWVLGDFFGLATIPQ
jgi:hypothetical protein